MTVQITHKRLTDGADHPHISDVYWANPDTGKTGQSTRGTMVDWIDKGGTAFVQSGATRVAVLTVHPSSGQAYIRTHADGQWTNNLLNLPDF